MAPVSQQTTPLDRRRISEIGAWLVLLWLLIRLSARRVSTFDIWWHVATGRRMLESGSLLPTDPFSYTQAGEAWTYKDWGADLLVAVLHDWGGEPALAVMAALCAIVGTLAIGQVLRMRDLPVGVIVIVIAVYLSAVVFRFSERPASLSFALTAVLILLLERHRAGVGRLLWVVPLTLVMANLHRGALAVPAIVLAYGLARFLEQRAKGERPGWVESAAVVAGCGLASVATPFGTAAAQQAFEVMAVEGIRQGMPEWQPFSLATMWDATPATLLIVATAGAGALWQRRLAWWDAALLSCGAGLALGGVRFFPYLALMAVPAAAGALRNLPSFQRPAGNVIAMGIAMVVLAAGWHRGPPGFGLDTEPRHYPEAGRDFVAHALSSGELRGRVFNEYHYGGYLLATVPDNPVFIDGRSNQIYGGDFILAYQRALRNPEAFAVTMDQWTVQWLFMDFRPYARARVHLDRNPDWSLIFMSEKALVYVRNDGPNAALAQRLAYRFLEPHQLTASVRRAWAVEDQRDLLLAEARRLVRDDPEYVEGWTLLGFALGQMGPAHAAELEMVEERLHRLGWSGER